MLTLQQIWYWEIERVEVPSGKFLIRISRWGKDLGPDEIIAPDDSYKGVMLQPWGEGRHFLNPFFWKHEVHEMVQVPAGVCLVLTRKFGRPLSAERIAEGEILGSEDSANPSQGVRGILPEVLTQGNYRLNSYAYSWERVKAVEIRVDQVGVRTLKVGKDPRTLKPDDRRGPYLVPDGYRGVQQSIVPAGTYYINPFVESITPVEVRSHRVRLMDIEFPSRDGFILQPQVVVEYAAQPDEAPELAVRLTDEGILHQRDETPKDQLENEILQKVILPHIRGYARIEGSNFDARDFILMASATVDGGPGAAKVANAREALQRALLDKVKPQCEALGVEVRAVTLADMRPPAELADQIAQRELARVEQAKNAARMGQYRAEQELMSKEALKEQAHEKVEAETRLIQGKTKSEQLKEVAQLKFKQELENAQLQLDAAEKLAEATLAKGKAEAVVIELKNEAEVAGLRKAVQGFDTVQTFAQYNLMKTLGPALSEIFASDDSDFGRLFSNYLTQPRAAGRKPIAPAAQPGSTAESAEIGNHQFMTDTFENFAANYNLKGLRRWRRLLIVWGLLSLGALLIIWTSWNAFFVYVRPGEHVVVTAKDGQPLTPGHVLAEHGQKGIQRDVLGDGWHFVLPIVYTTELEKNTDIPAGKVGIVTALGGKPLPPGRLLAEPAADPKDEERGIQRQVLPPGSYRINLRGYKVELVDATEIRPGYVGVRRRLLGTDGPGRFAEHEGEKGILRAVLQPGLYYLNPRNMKSSGPRWASSRPPSATTTIRRRARPSPSSPKAGCRSRWSAPSNGRCCPRTCRCWWPNMARAARSKRP